MPPRIKDIAGKRFGRLVVSEVVSNKNEIRSKLNRKFRSSGCVFKCYCDCGNISFVGEYELKKGSIKSCGCLRQISPFFRGLNINLMDIPTEVIKCLRAYYKLRKRIKLKKDFPMMRSERELIEWRKALEDVYSY